MSRISTLILPLIIGLAVSACGGESSSSSSPAPSGMSSDQKEKYNNLTPEGKDYVKQQMDAYDRAKK